MIAARERVSSLSAQAQGETNRLVNPQDKAGLNNSLVEFEKVMVEKEFATHAYQSALSSLGVGPSGSRTPASLFGSDCGAESSG